MDVLRDEFIRSVGDVSSGVYLGKNAWEVWRLLGNTIFGYLDGHFFSMCGIYYYCGAAKESLIMRWIYGRESLAWMTARPHSAGASDRSGKPGRYA